MALVGSLFEQKSPVIRELIGNMAMEVMPTLSPAFRDGILNSATVDASGADLGRDVLIKRRFYGGLSGVIGGGSHIGGDTFLYGSQTNSYYNSSPTRHKHFATFQNNAIFPDPLESTVNVPYGLTMKMHSVVTNLPLEVGMFQLEAMPATIEEQVMPVLRGFAHNIALWAANQWYGDPEGAWKLGTIATESADATDRTHVITVTEQTYHRFRKGQDVDIYDTTLTTLRNKNAGGTARTACKVAAVDPLRGTVTLQGDQNDTNWPTWEATVAATDVIVPARMAGVSPGGASGFEGMYAWRSFAKAGDEGASNANKRILGSQATTTSIEDYIDVTAHPEFRSFKKSSVGEFTEAELAQWLEDMEYGFDPLGYRIDTLEASRGVWLNVFVGMTGREIIDRGDRPGALDSLGINDGFVIKSSSGRSYRGMTNRFLEDGVIVGMKTRDNWQIMTMPDFENSGRQSLQGLQGSESKIPFHFAAPFLTGLPTNRLPHYVTSGASVQASGVVQLPGWITMQIVPKAGGQIPMFYATGASTLSGFTDVDS